jgi:hypothetical protein
VIKAKEPENKKHSYVQGANLLHKPEKISVPANRWKAARGEAEEKRPLADFDGDCCADSVSPSPSNEAHKS